MADITKQEAIAILADHLERNTTWGKMARPSQIRAAAKKKFDVMVGDTRKMLRAESKQAASQKEAA